MTGEKILIVDDSPESRSWLAQTVLQPAGYTILEASSLPAAHKKIAAIRPDLIVLDAQVSPAKDELSFVAEYTTSFPIVITTTHRSFDEVLDTLEFGAGDVLVKPFEPARLLTSIDRLLRHTQATRERDLLREQTDRQIQEFNALYTLGKNITALLDIDEILILVVNAAVNLTRAEEGALMLVDPDSGELYLRANRNLVEPGARNLRVRVNDTLMGRVLNSGRPIMMSGSELVKIQTWFLAKAILSVPLGYGERVTGVLSAANRISERAFGEHDVHLLTTLADYAAVAIENAQLFQQAQRRANELAALIEIDRHISASLDLPIVLERIATHARELLKADDSEVYLLEPDGRTLRAIVAIGEYAEAVKAQTLQLGEGVVGHIAESRVPEIIMNAAQDPRSVQILGTPDLVEALMCAPLISRGQLTGVMALTRVGEHPPFRPADLDFLIALAGQAAIAIENARLYEREQQRAAELAQALAQQQELDRLKNQFVQNISHELRTPLAIVRGYAELLESGELGKLQTGQLEPVNVMARRTRMLSKMLDDLIVILSVEAQTSAREPIDLRELVELTLADFEAAIQQAQLQLDIDLVDEPLPIVGDSNQLRRVIDNLLANAQKFTPGGGRVAIRLTRDHTEALLEVADSGIGIPDDQLNRIFERFYQVDGSPTRRYGGVGLGLALVKEIVEAHDGRVAVESVLGKGSSFRIWLPMNGPVIDQVDKATS